MTSPAALLQAKLAGSASTAIGDRATVTALREDGLVNVRSSTGSLYLGVPCMDSYTGRAVNDIVQLLIVNGVATVYGRYGADPNAETVSLKAQSGYLYNLLTGRLVDQSPSSLYIGQQAGSTAPPTQLATSYSSQLNSQLSGRSSSLPVYLRVSRSAEVGIGTSEAVPVRVMPHGSNTLPTGSVIAPLTTFSRLLVNLQVGEYRDVPLPADWIADIGGASPTIRGFVFQPGQFQEPGRPVDTTCSLLSSSTGGISYGQWKPYTPAWFTTGTQPAIGNGTITGRYQQTNGLVAFAAEIKAGSTSTFGSNAYSLGLPVPARVGSPSLLCLVRVSGGAGGIISGIGVSSSSSTSVFLQVSTSATNTALTALGAAFMNSTTVVSVMGVYEPA